MSLFNWDPLEMPVGAVLSSNPRFDHRLRSDIASLCKSELPGLFVVPDENDFRIIHALITGAPGTPYEGGFFYFILKCPADYPVSPPKVRLMTTDGGKVRFNPNLYSNGKVCLSILGTFPGPEWSSMLSITSLLICIQSIMNEKPYHNEPGYEVEKETGHAASYNLRIQHETIRVAVCGMLENDTGLTMPPTFVPHMRQKFLENYQYFWNVVQSNISLSQTPMQDPLYHDCGVFQFNHLLERLKKIRSKLYE